MTDCLLNPFTEQDLSLSRYPESKDKNLKSFDASDELVLSYLKELDLENKSLFVANDSWGALTGCLKQFSLTSYTDSYVAAKAIENNTGIKVSFDLEKIQGQFDIVVIKVPKNMSFFEDLLIRIKKCSHKETLFICPAMIKHLPKTAFDLLNKYIGETSTSLAKKKSRLIFATNTIEEAKQKYPKEITIDKWPHKLLNHSNVFSREKLDIGTRFFLDHIPSGPFKNILDLGCGNGILGLVAKKNNPEANIIYSDESFMALKSAQVNFETIHDSTSASFHWTNGYEDGEPTSVDLVLCNPPFHQSNTVGDFIAWQMFHDAKNALEKGGKILVVGNRHLGYHVKLKKIFKNSKTVASNKKFVIIEAIKN